MCVCVVVVCGLYVGGGLCVVDLCMWIYVGGIEIGGCVVSYVFVNLFVCEVWCGLCE